MTKRDISDHSFFSENDRMELEKGLRSENSWKIHEKFGKLMENQEKLEKILSNFFKF